MDLGLSIIMNWGTFIQLGIKSFGHVNYFCTLRTSILIDVLFIKKILIDVFLFFIFKDALKGIGPQLRLPEEI